MNHIKLFENLSMDQKFRNQIREMDILLNNLVDYLNFNKHFIEDGDDRDVILIRNLWIKPKPNKKKQILTIEYENNEGEIYKCYFVQKDYDDLLIFLDDPDAYKSAKKYNL